MAASGEFGALLHHVINAYVYGDSWERTGLSGAERSLVMLAITAAGNRPAEFRVHAKGALANGCTRAQVQDVYDEQGFGDKSADAIRAFIKRARASWRVPPRFVLLVGDATFDPRNFLGNGDFDFMPTRLIDTAAMETASDDWFVDDNLDGVPDVALGRLPVRTSAQATAVVGKLLGYAGNTAPDHVDQLQAMPEILARLFER